MSEAKHTPGPWFAEPPFVGANRRVSGGLDHDIVSATGGISVGPSEAEANAHLIAAAPELLEALEGILAYTRACEALLNASESGHCINARAAIAKAKGESQ